MDIVTKLIDGKICLELLISKNECILNNVGGKLKADAVIASYYITKKRKFPFFRKTYTLWIDMNLEDIQLLALNYYNAFEKTFEKYVGEKIE